MNKNKETCRANNPVDSDVCVCDNFNHNVIEFKDRLFAAKVKAEAKMKEKETEVTQEDFEVFMKAFFGLYKGTGFQSE